MDSKEQPIKKKRATVNKALYLTCMTTTSFTVKCPEGHVILATLRPNPHVRRSLMCDECDCYYGIGELDIVARKGKPQTPAQRQLQLTVPEMRAILAEPFRVAAGNWAINGLSTQ